jgi:peptide/nickel transport system substrate-binding protein
MLGRNHLRNHLRFPVFITLLVLSVACASQLAPRLAAASTLSLATPVPRGGDYRIATPADAPTLHPFKRTDSASDAYIDLLFVHNLWRYNPDTLEPEPWAAESWTVSADGKTFTFKLRESKWTDGEPVTAFDWQWTYDQAIKPENNWPYRGNAERNIASFVAADSRTLVITLKEAKPSTVALSRANALGAVLPKHVWEKYDWNDPTRNPEIMHPTVVSGPYQLKEWKRDDHITLTRNDLFFRGSPNIETITYRIVPSMSIGLQMMLNGEVDTATVSPNDFAQAKASDRLKLYEWGPADAAWDYVGFNLRRPPIDDVEFRHALTYATPRDQIVHAVFNDLSQPTYSAFPPSSWVYNPDVPRYDYSLETAQATLAKAGYPLDANGKRLGKDGRPVSLRLVYSIATSTSAKVAAILQDQLERLGIGVQLYPLENSAMLAAIKDPTYSWDMVISAWGAGVEPSDMRDLWTEVGIPSFNRGAYIDKKQEALWDQADKEFDPAKRKALYQQIQQIISEDSPYIFLAYRLGWSFQNKRIVPNPPTRMGIRYDIANWYIVDQP